MAPEEAGEVMRALPWLLVAIVTVAMSSGLADVPGWLAPDDYAPTSGACVAVMRPLPGIVDLVGLGGLLVLAFLGITRGGPILAPLAAFSIASTVVVVAVLANADGKARIERASMTALDDGLNRGVTAEVALRTVAEANLAIAARDDTYRSQLQAAMNATVTPALFEIDSTYRCVFRRVAAGRFARSFDLVDGPTKYEVHVATESGRVIEAKHHRYVDAERGAHNRIVTDLLD